MAKVLIVGGGFGGVVAAESLVRKLGREHQIVLVSRSRKFLFYPALVRLAFGRGEPDDVSFDLREAMLDRRITLLCCFDPLSYHPWPGEPSPEPAPLSESLLPPIWAILPLFLLLLVAYSRGRGSCLLSPWLPIQI